MEERVPMEMAPQMDDGVTAQGLTDSLLAEENAQQMEEGTELEMEIREGIGQLFEDGWTGEELRLLSEDEAVRMQIAAGKGLIRAAAMYLRRQMEDMRRAKAAPRRGLPVTRATAAGTLPQSRGIEQMTDAQFDAFSRQAREAAMMGRKVRM